MPWGGCNKLVFEVHTTDGTDDRSAVIEIFSNSNADYV